MSAEYYIWEPEQRFVISKCIWTAKHPMKARTRALQR